MSVTQSGWRIVPMRFLARPQFRSAHRLCGSAYSGPEQRRSLPSQPTAVVATCRPLERLVVAA